MLLARFCDMRFLRKSSHDAPIKIFRILGLQELGIPTYCTRTGGPRPGLEADNVTAVLICWDSAGLFSWCSPNSPLAKCVLTSVKRVAILLGISSHRFPATVLIGDCWILIISVEFRIPVFCFWICNLNRKFAIVVYKCFHSTFGRSRWRKERMMQDGKRKKSR
jgi:hypothetical protein